jgi:hypothetical protein
MKQKDDLYKQPCEAQGRPLNRHHNHIPVKQSLALAAARSSNGTFCWYDATDRWGAATGRGGNEAEAQPFAFPIACT